MRPKKRKVMNLPCGLGYISSRSRRLMVKKALEQTESNRVLLALKSFQFLPYRLSKVISALALDPFSFTFWGSFYFIIFGEFINGFAKCGF